MVMEAEGGLVGLSKGCKDEERRLRAQGGNNGPTLTHD